MKKVNWIILVGFVAALGFFTSCDGGETTDPIGAEIVFQSYDGSDIAITAGDTLEFSFVVNQGDEKINSVVVTLGTGSVNEPIYTATTLEDGMLVSIAEPMDMPGTYTATITVVDKGGIETKKTINVTVSSDLTEYTAILGAGGNVNGSYISTTGQVLNQTAAEAAPATVLFAYNEISSAATILSGTESTNTIIAAGASATTFEKLTGVSYDAASSVDIPETMTATTITIATGDVIAFRNADAVGIFEVGAIQAGTDGQAALTIGLKVVE